MTPSAQIQILAHTHGGQIDHVTDKQVGSVRVPMLPKDTARELDKSVLRARECRLERLERLWPGNGF